jgi:hypothetical protein
LSNWDRNMAKNRCFRYFGANFSMLEEDVINFTTPLVLKSDFEKSKICGCDLNSSHFEPTHSLVTKDLCCLCRLCSSDCFKVVKMHLSQRDDQSRCLTLDYCYPYWWDSRCDFIFGLRFKSRCGLYAPCFLCSTSRSHQFRYL